MPPPHYEESIDLSVRASDYLNLCSARGELGNVLLDADQIEAAITVLQTGVAEAKAKSVRGHTTVWLYVGLARAATLIAARARDPAALAEASSACRTAIEIGRRFRVGLVPALRAQAALSCLRGRSVQAHRVWNQAAKEAEALGARFEQALCALEVGTCMGDAGQRATALAALATMGHHSWEELSPAADAG